MRMDLAGERFQVEGYQVELPPGNHLTVIAGAHLGEPSYGFDHPNLAAKQSEWFEFKHDRKGGGKFWTSKAGVNFYFVIPKTQIELLQEKGYSDVPALIGGRKCRLNVSGGSGPGGWTDYVRPMVHVGCGWTITALKALATVALSLDECRWQGIDLAIEPLKDGPCAGFVEAAAAMTMRTRLGPGSQVHLQKGWDYQGSQGPFVVECRPRRKRYFLCTAGPARVRIPYAAINWTKTAEINGVVIPGPVLVNRISPLLEPMPV